MSNVKTVNKTLFVTEDGQEFSTLSSAEYHAEYLNQQKKVMEGAETKSQLLMESS